MINCGADTTTTTTTTTRKTSLLVVESGQDGAQKSVEASSDHAGDSDVAGFVDDKFSPDHTFKEAVQTHLDLYYRLWCNILPDAASPGSGASGKLGGS